MVTEPYMVMLFVLRDIDNIKWCAMNSYLKIITGLSLMSLFICEQGFARGCNKPQRICSTKDGAEYCYWKDDTSCRHCPRKECNINVGCKWSGFIIKKCASDFSSGSDEAA